MYSRNMILLWEDEMIIALVTMLEKCTDIVGMVRMEDTEREM